MLASSSTYLHEDRIYYGLALLKNMLAMLENIWLVGYKLVGGLRVSPGLFVSGSKLVCREAGAGSILMVGAGNWSA